MRIVALLLAFAALAERACRAPLPVRLLAMGFLRPAESVAWNFVAGEVALSQPATEVDDSAAAKRLAGSFRTLATALAALADRFNASSHPDASSLPMAVEAAGGPTDFDLVGPQSFDTS